MKYRAITSEQMYTIEQNAHSLMGMRRVYMMENAGHGVADFIINKFGYKLKGKRIVAVCGNGNNGGDAFVASRHLAGYHASNITIVLLSLPHNIHSEEARINWQIVSKMDSIKTVIPDSTSSINNLSGLMEKKIVHADIIIDGLLGTGIKGKIREPHASAIELINRCNAYILSLDVPSGLDPNTGRVDDRCIKADATMTFHRMKKGLLKAKEYTGPVSVERIGIPPEAEKF